MVNKGFIFSASLVLSVLMALLCPAYTYAQDGEKDVKDISGLYLWESEGHVLKGLSRIVVDVCINEDGSFIISGFPCPEKSAKMTVDQKSGKIRIADNQNSGIHQGDSVYLYCYSVTVNQDSRYIKKRVEAAYGDVMEDGTIKFPCLDPDTREGEEIWFGMATPEGESDNNFICLYGWNKFMPTSYNTPADLSDYHYIGDGVFTDGWFNPLLRKQGKPEIKDVTCRIWRSNSVSTRYLVEDPYGDERWKSSGLKAMNKKGYLMFDTMNPKCVIIVPLVSSGMMMAENTDKEENARLSEYYLMNDEGHWFYIYGDDIDEVIGEFDDPEVPASSVEGNMVTFRNLSLGKTGAISECKWWGSYQDNATLLMPEGWAGISDIEADVSASPRYFNLQGMEVSNPEPGSIVIRKTGSKTEKIIFR